MRAILLAGGKGTRLHPFTANLPKPLVPIGDKAVLEILITRLKNHGFKKITLCTGHLAPLLKSYFGNGKKFGVSIDYSHEHKPLGTVGPLTLIKDLPKTFLVANGDLLTTANFSKMLDSHKNQKADLTVGVFKRKEKINLGVLNISDGKIIKYQEKPTHDYYISTGMYIFNKDILSQVKKNTYYDFPSLVNKLLKNKKKVLPYYAKGYWLDIGRPDDYNQAQIDYSNNPRKFLKF